MRAAMRFQWSIVEVVGAATEHSWAAGAAVERQESVMDGPLCNSGAVAAPAADDGARLRKCYAESVDEKSHGCDELHLTVVMEAVYVSFASSG